MELDTVTLRVALGLVCSTLALLFYGVTFRNGGSLYSLWWSLSLVMFLCGAAGYLLFVPGERPWVVPTANAFLTLGAAMTWSAARALRARRQVIWPLIVFPAASALASAVDDPSRDVWAGGAVFLLVTAVSFGASATELFRVERSDSRVAMWLGVAAALMSAYYGARLIAYLPQGADGDVFVAYFDSGPTTLINLAFLVLVSFTMSQMATESSIRDLRQRATHDGLTGLANRSEFYRQTESMLARGRGGALLAIDIDHFKELNDQHGHAAGDAALAQFAATCRRHVRPGDLIARVGGEEFAIVMPGAGPDVADDAAERIRDDLAGSELFGGIPMPTASFGIVAMNPAIALSDLFAAADRALYVAKLEGRNRSVRAADPPSGEGTSVGS